VRATTIASLETQSARIVGELEVGLAELLRARALTVCVACTDVHEYGKILLEAVLRRLGIAVVDGGVSADPEQVAARARGCDALAISSYNGVALRYVQALGEELSEAGLGVPIYVGGRLNQLPEGSVDELPIDVRPELAALGAIVCARVEEMLVHLARLPERPTAEQAPPNG
jgi:methylmalonyl-CoA mutase cobalamin-binding subunit